jgi:hypothetical protein
MVVGGERHRRQLVDPSEARQRACLRPRPEVGREELRRQLLARVEPGQEMKQRRVEIDLVAAQDGQVGLGVGWQARERRTRVAGRVAGAREARPEEDRERTLDRRRERGRHGCDRRPREDLPGPVDEPDRDRGPRRAAGHGDPLRTQRPAATRERLPRVGDGRDDAGDVEPQAGDGRVDDPDPDRRRPADELAEEQVSIAVGLAHAGLIRVPARA